MSGYLAGTRPGAHLYNLTHATLSYPQADATKGKKEGRTETMSTTDTMAMRPLLFPGDTQFWYETLRALGHTAYGGADVGEVVTTAQRIKRD
jgi:hypothetical protein